MPDEVPQAKRFGLGNLSLVYSLIWVLALLVRLIFLWQMYRTEIWGLTFGDGDGYDRWAQRIAQGDWVGQGVFYQAPLYPYFLGLLYSLLGRDFLVLRLVQAVIGATSCVLLARAGESFFSRKAGICSGMLLALYPTAILFDYSIQKSVLDLFFICGLLAALGRLSRRPMRGGWLVAGMVLGLLALTRENALVFLPVILTWLGLAWRGEPARKRLGWAGWFLLGLGTVLFPVVLRNQIVGGEFHLTTAQFGPNFYIGNNRTASGLYRPLVQARQSFEFEQDDATHVAEQAVGRKLKPGEVSRFWTAAALADIRQDFGHWLYQLGRKSALLCNFLELGDSDDQYTYGEQSLLLRTLTWLLNFGTILPLALWGILLTWPQRRQLWLLYAMLLGYAASVVIFYVFARYRFPLIAPLLLFVAAGLTGVRTALQAGRVRMVVSGAALALGAAFGCNRSLVPENPMRATTHYNFAVALVSQENDHAGALAHCTKALRLDPDSVPARHVLAFLLMNSGQMQEGIDQDLIALKQWPDYVDAHNSVSDALLTLGEFDEAGPHIAAVLRLQPDDPEAHYNNARLLVHRGKLDEAVSEAQIAVRLDPASEKNRSKLAELEWMKARH